MIIIAVKNRIIEKLYFLFFLTYYILIMISLLILFSILLIPIIHRWRKRSLFLMHIVIHQSFRKPIIRLPSNNLKIFPRTSSIQRIAYRLIYVLLSLYLQFVSFYLFTFLFLQFRLFVRIRVHGICLHFYVLLDLFVVFLELRVSILLDGRALIKFYLRCVVVCV